MDSKYSLLSVGLQYSIPSQALSLITVPLFSFLTRRKEMHEEAARALPDEREEEIREEQKRLDYGVGTTAQMTPEGEREVEEAERLDENAISV